VGAAGESYLTAQPHVSALTQEETNVGRPFADDDRVRIGKPPAIDGHDEIAGREAGKRAMDAARELIVGRTHSDCLAHGKREYVADAQRRCERKGSRTADCDGVEVERNLHADHPLLNFCRIEELPAGGDK
jgi:hypothetical protein